MADDFASYATGLESPASKMFLITPHASTEITPSPRAIRANGAGDVVLRAFGSAADVTVTMAAGEILPVRAQFIRASGTTVAVLHGLA